MILGPAGETGITSSPAAKSTDDKAPAWMFLLGQPLRPRGALNMNEKVVWAALQQFDKRSGRSPFADPQQACSGVACRSGQASMMLACNCGPRSLACLLLALESGRIGRDRWRVRGVGCCGCGRMVILDYCITSYASERTTTTNETNIDTQSFSRTTWLPYRFLEDE